MANYPPNPENVQAAWQAKYQAKKQLQAVNNPLYYLQQGNRLLAQNKLMEAIVCYRRALKLDPHHTLAQQQLASALKQASNRQLDRHKVIEQPHLKSSNNPAVAQIYLQQAHSYEARGEWQSAIAACQKALNFAPELAEAHKTWGDNLVKSGNIIESLEHYATALAIKPDFAEVCLNLGSLSVKQQQWQLALNYFQQAIAINPNYAEAYRNLARIYKKLNQTQSMLECWFKALQLEPEEAGAAEHRKLARIMAEFKQPHQAIFCYQQALKLQPQAADVYLELGALFIVQNNSSAAIDTYQQGLKYFPRHHQLNLRLAQLLEPDNLTDAIAHYRRAIASNPQDWQAHFQLGLNLARQQQYAAARDCYQKVVQLKPQYLAAYIKLVEMQQVMQQWWESVPTCQQGLNLAPQQTELYRYLGLALIQLKKYDGAIKVYSRCLELDPDLRDNYRHLGIALMAQQKWSEAISCYQKLLKLEPNCLDSLRKLGEAATQAGQWSISAIAWAKAIQLQSNEPWAYHHLGMALINLEKWAEATKALQHSIQLNPDFCWSYYHLGDALAKQERWSESSTAYRSFLSKEVNAYAYERLGDNLLRQIKSDRENDLLRQEAQECYYRAIEVDPSYLQPYYKLMELKPYDAEICLMLAETYARAEKWSTAIIFYQIGLTINSSLPQAHFELGIILEQQQQLPEAIAHYQSAIKLAPNQAIYQSYLTEALSKDNLLQIKC